VATAAAGQDQETRATVEAGVMDRAIEGTAAAAGRALVPRVGSSEVVVTEAVAMAVEEMVVAKAEEVTVVAAMAAVRAAAGKVEVAKVVATGEEAKGAGARAAAEKGAKEPPRALGLPPPRQESPPAPHAAASRPLRPAAPLSVSAPPSAEDPRARPRGSTVDGCVAHHAGRVPGERCAPVVVLEEAALHLKLRGSLLPLASPLSPPAAGATSPHLVGPPRRGA